MIKRDLIVLHRHLGALNKIAGARLAYACGKNMKLIEDEMKVIEPTIAQSEKYKEYEMKRIELCSSHAEKDENENAIMIDGVFDIRNMTKFKKEHDKLQEEYKEDIDAHNLKVVEYNKLLDEECDIEFKKIKLEVVPETYEEELEDKETKIKTKVIRPIGILLKPVIFLVEE